MLRGKQQALVAVAVVGVMALGACGGSSSGGGGNGGSGGSGSSKVDLPKLATSPVDTRVGKSGGTFKMSIAEPVSIDPYNAQESEGILVSKNIFDTLTTVTPDGKIQKLLAASYSSDKACTNWTFTLKSGQKFSNGEAVDAESIKRGMTRTAVGKAASVVAYHMEGIKGYDELQADKATDFSGVTASGLVLKIALTAADCEFDLKTAQPVFSPVPVEAGAFNNASFNDMPIGNGPFKMDGPWQHDKSITLVRNENYTDGPKPLLDKVEIAINDGSVANYEDQNFKLGDLDYARVTSQDLQDFADKYYSTVSSKNQFLKIPAYAINYLIPNVANAPLTSVKAREAVSYAIDRDGIIKSILHDSQTKATSFVGPAFAGQGTYQPGICASCVKQDTAKAKQLAKEAGLPPGTKVNLAFNTGSGQEGWIQAVAGELDDVLGWKVNIQPEPFKTLLANMNDAKATGLFRSNWAADYPTAWDVLQPNLGTQPPNNPGNNSGRYSNTQVDQLLASGQAQTDPVKRADDYKQAERIAIGQDLALIPLWYYTQYSVFNPKFV
ncbi:MAG: ABC-type transporter, periplasmic subunit, partial [Mycobacterium sp.]|nr:ABC-type transporter, periplasmic subunit [Mycobacterium sp.]